MRDNSSRGRFARLALMLVVPAAIGPQAPPALGQDRPAPARSVPEGLNFANGLLRERHFEAAAEEYTRFLRDAKPGPDADDALFGLANARLFQGQYEKARQGFEEFLKAAPEHPNAGTAWYRVGETAYMLGDLPAARRAFETFTANYPRHRHLGTAWPYLGDVCFRLGDTAKARQAYERALAEHAEGRLADRARFGLGRTLALQGEPDRAIEILTALAGRGGKDWADKAWLQVGKVEAGAGRHEKALAAFQAAERATPDGPLVAEARLNQGEALARLGRREEAEALLNELRKSPVPGVAAQAAFALGTTQLEGGQAAEALETLDQASTLYAKTPMAAAITFRSAEAALKLGRTDDARARFLKAAEADPADPWADDAQLRAAAMALEAGDLAEARRLAAAFAGKFPRSPLRADARLIDARAALGERKPKEAIAALAASLEADEPSPATAQSERYYLGLAYRADGQADKAAEILDALAKDPTTPVAADALFMVGQAHIEAKRYAEAIPPLEKYLETQPEGEVADYALAHLSQARLESGRADAAEEALNRLAERFPRSKALGAARLRLAEAALDAKRYDRAAELFRLVAEGDDPALKPRAQSGLGWALLGDAKAAEAASAFGALLAAAPDDPLAPQAALARGRALQAAGQADPALEAYALVLEKYAKSESAGAAALARARLLAERKRPGEAAQVYAAYVESHPEPKPPGGGPALDAVLAEWGWALVDAEKPEEADKVFARLLEEFPDSPLAADARFNLAESAYQAKQLEKVESLLGPVVAEGSKAAPRIVESALYRLGRTQADRREWAAAAATFERLAREAPEGPYVREARFWRAEALFQADDAKAAEPLFAALADGPAAASDPEGLGRTARRRRVQCLAQLGRWEEALGAADAYKADSPKDPQLPEVDYARGRALQGLARFDEAREAFRAVIDARKGGDLAARAQLMVGETYFHQKNYREALREFLRVEVLYNVPAWKAAAMLEEGKVYERLERWADAVEAYERLRTAFPDDRHAAEAGTRLEAARRKVQGGGGEGVANAGERGVTQ